MVTRGKQDQEEVQKDYSPEDYDDDDFVDVDADLKKKGKDLDALLRLQIDFGKMGLTLDLGPEKTLVVLYFYDQGVRVTAHEKFNNETNRYEVHNVCERQLGRACKWCDMGIQEAFVDHGVKTLYFFCYQVWCPDLGLFKLSRYQHNQASPMERIINLNDDIIRDMVKGGSKYTGPKSLNEVYLQMTQHGAKAKRTFDVVEYPRQEEYKDSLPDKYEVWGEKRLIRLCTQEYSPELLTRKKDVPQADPKFGMRADNIKTPPVE